MVMNISTGYVNASCNSEITDSSDIPYIHRKMLLLMPELFYSLSKFMVYCFIKILKLFSVYDNLFLRAG